jgi:hypothetical protein
MAAQFSVYECDTTKTVVGGDANNGVFNSFVMLLPMKKAAL